MVDGSLANIVKFSEKNPFVSSWLRYVILRVEFNAILLLPPAELARVGKMSKFSKRSKLAVALKETKIVDLTTKIMVFFGVNCIFSVP